MTLEVKESGKTIGTLLDAADRPGDMGGGVIAARWPGCPFSKVTDQKYAWSLEAPGLAYDVAWLNVVEPGSDGARVEIRYRKKGAKK